VLKQLDAKEFAKESLLARKNVVGVAVGKKYTEGKPTDELSVVVLVEKKVTPQSLDALDLIPQEVNGVKTDVFAVGRLEALVDRKARHRPAPGGVSIGHHKITAGTLGAVVTDVLSGKRVILSNNHVLANSNDAMIGDAILQQGYYDGGRLSDDIIGNLLRYKEIEFGEEPADCPIAEGVAKVMNTGAKVIKSKHRMTASKIQAQAVNYIDAAIAEPVSDGVVLDEILDIGVVNGTIYPYLGMSIRKSGRTTGYTHGSVLLLHGTVNVSYGGDKIARFEEQIIAGAMSAGGDSGSLGVAEDENKAFGLLYAGSAQSTIFNPIDKVIETLLIKF
jgi:hypothetical protein